MISDKITPEALAKKITKQAKAAGFDVVAFTGVNMAERDKNALFEMVDENRHGKMQWMEDKADWRKSPISLWDDVKSVVILGMNYGPKIDPMLKNNLLDIANISAYAQNRDYHDLIKKRLKQIARWLVEETNCQLKVFTDTAPVLEKALAARTSIGWQGKHSNIVSREYGSWLFLGEIFTTLELPISDVEIDNCGNCSACIDICPTKAIIAPYKIDARRCISYLTIEYNGHIAEEFRKPIGNRVYGCDDCMAICPWNKFGQITTMPDFIPRDDLTNKKLTSFLMLHDQEFRTLFSKSPVKRIKRDKFIRNILIATGNSGDSSVATINKIISLINDPAAIVRAMAIWALKQLLPNQQFIKLKDKYMARENDYDVKAEWHI